MRFFILAFFMLLLWEALQAGNVIAQETSLSTIQSLESGDVNLGTAFWSSAGSAIADTTNPEALLYNPAWRISAKHVIIGGGIVHSGMELGYSFADPLIPTKVSIQPQYLLPDYLIAASAYRTFLFQAGYRLLYATNFKYEQDAIVNNVHYQGTVFDDTFLHDFFIGINRLLNPRLSVGVQAGLALLTASVKQDQKVLANAVGNGFHLRLGMLYRPAERLSLAITYRHINPIDYQYSTKELTLFTPDSRKYTITFPDFYALGVSFLPGPHVNISMRVRYEHFNENHSDDRFQLGAGIRFRSHAKWALGFGAFTLRDLPGGNHFEDVVFLTAGFSYAMLPNLELELSGLTSHFTSDFSSDTQQLDQTRVLFGIQLFINK